MTYKERFLTLHLEAKKLRQDCATYFRGMGITEKKSGKKYPENDSDQKNIGRLKKQCRCGHTRSKHERRSNTGTEKGIFGFRTAKTAYASNQSVVVGKR